MFGLSNPQRFMRFTGPLTPVLWTAAAVLLAVGTWLSFTVPADYQQGDTVRIMFVHVPAASLGLGAYAALGVSSFFALVFRHALADAAARAAALPGAAFTALALFTGSLWGQPMWGTWWVWDARLTSVLVLFLFYLGYMALRASIDDEQKGARAAAVLGLVGLINLPIVKFSVDWWNTLHQPASFLTPGASGLDPVYLPPFLTMLAAYGVLFAALWLTAIRTEIRRRRVLSLADRSYLTVEPKGVRLADLTTWRRLAATIVAGPAAARRGGRPVRRLVAEARPGLQARRHGRPAHPRDRPAHAGRRHGGSRQSGPEDRRGRPTHAGQCLRLLVRPLPDRTPQASGPEGARDRRRRRGL